ncbi:MAG: TolC family protein [Salinivirgaceae bacterium]|nr:TolC family protein [Salinivirgaceae bacterium]
MKKIIINLLSIFFAISVVDGQEANKVLTLNDVVQLALEQSPHAILAKHKYRSSYWEYRSYKSSMLPALTLDANVLNFNNTYRSIPQEDGSEVYRNIPTNSSGANLSLQQNVGLTGGRIFISSDLERRDDFNADSNGISYKSTPIRIGYLQPAFQFNAYKWEKKIEPIKFEEAKKQYVLELEQIAERAINSFYNLATSQLNVDISSTNFHNNDTLYKIAQGRYNMGTIAENELLQLELSYLQSKSALAQSKIDLEISMFQLRSFLGFNELVKIKLEIDSDIPELEINLDQAFEKATENSGELLAYQRQLFEVERDVAKAKAENRFNANLYATYGLNQTAYNFNNSYEEPDNQQEFRVGIQIPILDWGEGKGRYKMAQSNQEVIRTQVQQSRIDFQQRVMLKVMQFNEQSNQVYIAAKADTVAQKRFKVAKQRFLIGKINVLDLNMASADKDMARRSNLMAQKTYWTYYYNIRQLTLFDFLNNKALETEFDSLIE